MGVRSLKFTELGFRKIGCLVCGSDFLLSQFSTHFSRVLKN